MWMKRRGQPSPSPANPGVQIYNPNQHSAPQQPFQQWPQQPQPVPQQQQQYSTDWYNQSKVTSKTPPVQQYPQTNNYWQQPGYNQPQQNFNTSLPNQPVNQYQQQQQQQQQPYNQYANNQPQNYYQNAGYGQENYNQQPSQQYNYAPQNYYTGQQQPPQQLTQQNTLQNSNSPALVSQISAQPSESDPWNWGWDDGTNANTQAVTETVNAANVAPNNITESFAGDESWNWTVDDNNSHTASQSANSNQLNQRNEQVINKVENSTDTSQNVDLSNQQHSTITKDIAGKIDSENNDSSVQNSEHNQEFYSNSSQPVGTVENLPPSMPSVRRVMNENLTPQWSIESQVSQDSSEDVLLTSESDNRSNMLSQSSTTSQSPSLATYSHEVHTNEYLPQTYRYDTDNATSLRAADNVEPVNREIYHNQHQENSQSLVDNVSKGMQELSLIAQFENKEIVTPEVASQQSKEETQPPPPKDLTPPPPPKKMTPPLLPPPAQGTSDKNPYKRNSGLSHKSANKLLVAKEPVVASTGSQNIEPSPVFLQNTSSAFSQPSPRPTDNLGVNLETLPDNSERPDQIPAVDSVQKTVRKTSTVQPQWAENCEIAPINDRNQYLETGQLSDADVPVYTQSGNDNRQENMQGTSVDTSDSFPPPGLRRLVLGQLEQSEPNQVVGNAVDEPPPGLSRMVLGSTAMETKKDNVDVMLRRLAEAFPVTDFLNNEGPPAGLHRMVPGESSSPESSSRPVQSVPVRYTPAAVFQPATFEDADHYVSESELNQMNVTLVSQRSATIGADTPPVTNQQAISNTGYSSSSSVDPITSREGAVGIDNEDKKLDMTGSNTTDDNYSAGVPSDSNRREAIDGGPVDEISTVRDQTVGQNSTDSATLVPNQAEKHRNRNYTTDSEQEQPKERHNRGASPGGPYDKDRRYYEDRRGDRRDRDSPDRFRGERDRKYDRRRHKDRRYEEDTDYYSDKERRERRHKLYEEHERRYNSLRSDKERGDTDYYSDKERRERRRKLYEEHERRYNSLRSDKERDIRREPGDRHEYDRDDRRSDYYYNGRYDDESYANRSRPSSRSDSMHDSYRERNHRPHERERDQDRTRARDSRRPRDPYTPYYQGYNYDAYNPYYQQYQYQYYENLRRTNPQAYAEWYRKYYQNQGGAAPHAAGYSTEDRASVHSGRSSANEELNKDRYTRQSFYSQQSLPHYYRENFRDIQNASTVYTADDSRLLDQTDSSLILEDSTVTAQRLTPAKFSTAHVKASIASGSFINILPHYPLDGQPATLEIINLQSLLVDDEDQKTLAEFPGPLVKGVTHKKTVIEYCENKIKKVQGSSNVQDVESYVLMWELLILLLRQNGMVVGTDIAELLMKNRTAENSGRQSISSASSTQHLDTAGEHATDQGARVSPAMHYKEDFITDKFREFLIYGSGKEALEWAMKHGLWGHALFLASKLDKRTYANVMMRFANGLTMNDPLQTLYQLLSGRQPASVTSVADDKWGDWRPHLAMILSNTSQRPDLDRKAITTLGDTLHARGSLYAAHFCYLMAQIEFSRYGAPNAKLVLLSASHSKPFTVFASNEAIFMTEIYEYACSLSDATFTIPEFQSYKYLMATRMVDHGLLEKGLLYLERVALSVKQDPTRAQQSLVLRVCELADRLKYCDPVQDDADLDSSRADSLWLADLKVVLNDYNMGLIKHQSSTNLTSPESEQQDINSLVQDQQQYPDRQWQQQQEYYQQPQHVQPQWQDDQPTIDYTQQQQQQQQQQMIYQETDPQQQTSFDSINYSDQQQQSWPQQQQPTWEENAEASQQRIDEQQQQQQQHEYWNSAQSEEPMQPQISMPNQTQMKSYYDDGADQTGKSLGKLATPVKPKPTAPAQTKASTGFFGGIWSKLALRPKNQMKLPDDKNPTIVWDSEKKRWVNLEEDNVDTSTELKPPPKMSEMFSSRPMPSGPPSLPPQAQNYPVQTISPAGVPLPTDPTPPVMNNTSVAPAEMPAVSENDGPKPPSQPNMFKLQRTRNIKKAYVDVFNPGGTSTAKSTVPAPEVFSAVPSTGAQMNFFVPQPHADPNAPTDFLTSQTGGPEDNSQLSRWSSSSSLSREVQFYMQRAPTQTRQQTGGAAGNPMMYNPTQFSNQQTQNSGARGRYPNH